MRKYFFIILIFGFAIQNGYSQSSDSMVYGGDCDGWRLVTWKLENNRCYFKEYLNNTLRSEGWMMQPYNEVKLHNPVYDSLVTFYDQKGNWEKSYRYRFDRLIETQEYLNGRVIYKVYNNPNKEIYRITELYLDGQLKEKTIVNDSLIYNLFFIEYKSEPEVTVYNRDKRSYNQYYTTWSSGDTLFKQYVGEYLQPKDLLLFIKPDKKKLFPTIIKSHNPRKKTEIIEHLDIYGSTIGTEIYDSKKTLLSSWEYDAEKNENRFYFDSLGHEKHLKGRVFKTDATTPMSIRLDNGDSLLYYAEGDRLSLDIFRGARMLTRKILYFKYHTTLENYRFDNQSEIISEYLVHKLLEWYRKDDMERAFEDNKEEIINYYTDGSVRSFFYIENHHRYDYVPDSGETNIFLFPDLNESQIDKDLASCKYGVREGFGWLVQPIYDNIDIINYINNYYINSFLWRCEIGDSLHLVDIFGNIIYKMHHLDADKWIRTTALSRQYLNTSESFLLCKNNSNTLTIEDRKGKILFTYSNPGAHFDYRCFNTESLTFTKDGNTYFHRYDGKEWKIQGEFDNGYAIAGFSVAFLQNATKTRENPLRYVTLKNGGLMKYNFSMYNHDTLLIYTDSGLVAYDINAQKIIRKIEFMGIPKSSEYEFGYKKKNAYPVINFQGQRGMISPITGNMLTPFQYEFIQDNIFKRDGKWGLFNKDNTREIIHNVDTILSLKLYHDEDIFTHTNQGWMVHNSLGGPLLKNPVDELILVEHPENYNRYLCALKNGEIYWQDTIQLNNSNEKLWANIGTLLFKNIYSKKYGILKNGKVIFTADYDQITTYTRTPDYTINEDLRYKPAQYVLNRNNTTHIYNIAIGNSTALPSFVNSETRGSQIWGLDSLGKISIIKCDGNAKIPKNVTHIGRDKQYLWFSRAQPTNGTDYGYTNFQWELMDSRTGYITPYKFFTPYDVEFKGKLLFLKHADMKYYVHNDSLKILFDKGFDEIFYNKFSYKTESVFFGKIRNEFYEINTQTASVNQLNYKNPAHIGHGYLIFDDSIVRYVNADNSKVFASASYFLGEINLTNYTQYRQNYFDSLKMLKDNFLTLTAAYIETTNRKNYNYSYWNRVDVFPKVEYYTGILRKKEIELENARELEKLKAAKSKKTNSKTPTIEQKNDSEEGYAEAYENVEGVAEPMYDGYHSPVEMPVHRFYSQFASNSWFNNLELGPQILHFTDFNEAYYNWAGRLSNDDELFINLKDNNYQFLHIYFDVRKAKVYRFNLYSILSPEKISTLNSMLYLKLKDIPKVDFPCVQGADFVKFFNNRFTISHTGIELFDLSGKAYSLELNEISPFLNSMGIQMLQLP